MHRVVDPMVAGVEAAERALADALPRLETAAYGEGPLCLGVRAPSPPSATAAFAVTRW